MATTMTEHNNNNPFGAASFDSDLDDSDLSSITGGSPSTNDLDDSPNIIATEISLPNSQATYISDDEETTGWDSSDSIKGESNINELLKVAESIQCGISIGDVSKNYDGYESEDFYQEEDNENNCGFEFAHLYADLDTDAGNYNGFFRSYWQYKHSFVNKQLTQKCKTIVHNLTIVKSVKMATTLKLPPNQTMYTIQKCWSIRAIETILLVLLM